MLIIFISMLISTVRAEEVGQSRLMLLGEKTETSARQIEYADMNRVYDQRKASATVTRQDEIEHQAANQKMAHSVAMSAFDRHVRNVKDGAEQAARENPGTAAALKPAALLAGAYMFYRGKRAQTRLGNDAVLGGKVEGAEKRAEIDLAAGTQQVAIQGDARSQDRFKSTVRKAIPAIGVDTSVSYAFNSKQMGTLVAKQITRHVSGVWETGAQQSVRLQLGMGF